MGLFFSWFWDSRLEPMTPTVGGKELMTYRILNRRTAPLEQSHCLFRMTHSGRLPLALSTGETLPSLPSGGNLISSFLKF